jgi:iron-sulfur cluster assembly accessory protein
MTQSIDKITLSDAAIKKISETKSKIENENKFLRISVSGGGCSGFQYIFELDNNSKEEDIEILKIDNKIFAVTDQTSLPFLSGSEIDYVIELGASFFKVNNPNATAKCGCGSSFSI